MSTDAYRRDIIKAGGDASQYIAERMAITKTWNQHVKVITEGMHGVAVARTPENYQIVAHSIGADPRIREPKAYAASLVDRLVAQARLTDAIPVGFSNVIDVSKKDDSVLKALMDGYEERCSAHKIAAMNGEYAIIGGRAAQGFNISGTMISLIPKAKFNAGVNPLIMHIGEHHYVIFEAGNKAVYLNSDGNGTKPGTNERKRQYGIALNDLAAMNLDDTIRLGAHAKLLAAVVETSGDIPFEEIQLYASQLSRQIGVQIIIQREVVGNRLQGYKPGIPVFSLSGTAVSTIDDDLLQNPLKPSLGEYVVAVTAAEKDMGPRCNGLTVKQSTLVEHLGLEWHATEEGMAYLDYLTRPSTILYPVFCELLDKKLATSFYHMSGGAFDEKLAKPFARHGVQAQLENIFHPHDLELKLMELSGTSVEDAYAKFPMGNEGFFTAPTMEAARKAVALIKGKGLQAEIVAKLQHGSTAQAALGLYPTVAPGERGRMIYFSGKK